MIQLLFIFLETNWIYYRYMSFYGAKCGIYDGNCWSRFFGYPCCEKDHKDDPDVTTDSHGSW